MLYQKEIKVSKEYDLVVCGGGFSGFSAAYASAREGLKTLVIERGSSLGGVGTQGLVNHILGARTYKNGELKTCVGGIFSEIEQNLLEDRAAIDSRRIDFSLNPHGWYSSLGAGLIFENEKMKLLLEKKLIDVGAEILYYTDIVDVIKNGSRIDCVVIHNKSGLRAIRGRYFVDATGDGDICMLAGCGVMFGDKESGTSAASLEMHVENVDYVKLMNYMKETQDVRFKNIISELKKRDEWPFLYEIFISVMLTRKDVFMINTIRQVGINGIDGESLSKGTIEGRKENFKLFEIMKKHFPGFENATIRQIAPVIGIRETRRIKSEYILTVEDLISGRKFCDSIAISGYGWDMPDPKKPSYQPYHGVERNSDYTQIPYGCLLPVGIDNVIIAGRCIGVEREVLGVVRVMAPCIAMGECAGIASKLAAENNISYRDVNIQALKNKISKYGGITEIEQIRSEKIGTC